MWSHQVEKYCVLTKSTWILKHEWTFLQIFQTRCDLCCVCFCVCLYEKFLYKRKTKKYVSLTANLQDTLIRTRYVFDRKIGDKICDENLCVRAVCILCMCVLVWTISDLHKSTTQTHDGLIEHCIHNSKKVFEVMMKHDTAIFPTIIRICRGTKYKLQSLDYLVNTDQFGR